ncbi:MULTISPECIES: protein arginine kinase [Clostridium]|uniref:Protein-arginine kinase n=2 Tax=Clostridium TaxID=1485 RepID=A0A151AMC7_9CLOT|nr:MULTISPECIES: protein arginine kinase [Clostridium]KYH28783.1 putative ATP:guanido phosphotransferase [Clostridium colicanis DSM 13634]MBE6043354.1 protein arginine kinase [Clostridium thermopalmarium]PRR76146.1 putative ATP:guanido phosphotransferase [Clostridium thermopalmarium DSM 5974]PVZ21401.1 protein arginine kinase [Clostridium thermopalmarium DSM 5974]
MKSWIETQTENEDVVLSSRIRLARNLKNAPFPNKLNEEQGKDIVKNVEDAFYSSPYTEEKFKTIYLWQNDDVTNQSYFERHLISERLISNKKEAAFIVDEDETVSIMINEEDHLRLQAITGGLNLKEAFNYINKLDDLLEERLEYAFNEKLGYLTSCPTNLGTGLRASVMLHLPALTANNEIVGLLNALTQVGMTIRGLYGEGSRGEGNLYQISNQTTLGLSEEEILTNLAGVINQVINRENLARERILSKNRYEIEDKIFRSVGILKSAVMLSSKECLNLLSNVRLGVEMGIIKDIDKNTLNKLLVDIQPASLQKATRQKLFDKQRDLNRAILVKERLKNVEL